MCDVGSVFSRRSVGVLWPQIPSLQRPFAGLSLIRKDAQKEPQRHSRPVDQQNLEAMLPDRARSLGIDLHRECDVASFVQQAGGVDVEWTSPTGADHIRCAYLVACDGGRSFIRKRAGFDFPGTEPSSTFYQAVAQIDQPERLAPIGWRCTSGGVFSYGPFPGRLVMLEFSDNKDGDRGIQSLHRSL
jgi:2-polyprenyl-6-methoxyphenol hydroxylase-like FAD-dependent oxidoreductase